MNDCQPTSIEMELSPDDFLALCGNSDWRIIWCEPRRFSAVEAGESISCADDLLRIIQARRDSGDEDADAAFFVIARLGKTRAKTSFDTGQQLPPSR
jgi:hypothetical protein